MALDHGENFFSDGRDPRRLFTRTQLENQIEDRADHELARKRAEFETLQRRHRQEMDDLVARKSSMFGRTPPEVSVNALTLAIEEAHHQAKLRVAEGKPDEMARDIRLFQPRIQGKEVAFHVEGKDGKPSFVDDGKNIFVPAYNDDIALLASLQLAQMRWGIIKVSGTDDFKERVVQLAADYDLHLANEDLALRVHQRRSSPGTLSAPSEQEIVAAQKFKTELEGQRADPADDTSPPKRPVTQAAPEDDDETLIEDDTSHEKAPEPTTEMGRIIVGHPKVGNVTSKVDDKAWIAQLQEERRRKVADRAEKAEIGAQPTQVEKDNQMQIAEYDRAVEAEVNKIKAKGSNFSAAKAANTEKDDDMPQEPIEIEEPEKEPDLGYDDDDDFSVDVPSASSISPEAKKTAGVGARP